VNAPPFEEKGFGVVLYDVDRRIVAADDEAASLYGLPAPELVGRNVTEFVRPSDRDDLAAARETYESTGSVAGHYVIHRPDGAIQPMIYALYKDQPMPGLNLLVLGADSEDGDADRAAPGGAPPGGVADRAVRREGDAVYFGAALTDHERSRMNERVRARLDSLQKGES
jgi:PAS domain S-box-containing protein